MENNHAIHPDILMVFNQLPEALPLYEAGEEKIRAAFPDVRIKVSKTQINFYNKYLFAALWPPLRKIKGRPGLYIVLTFGLGHRLEHPRIVEAVEPYPNRWTHHVLINAPEEFDAQVMAWLKEAYAFSMNK
ncbi:DUF5655 domain-containing protein [Christensenellaceae bacterium OttesenSCG-928-L17]|nr:DUF5655 domain-containing protein [Christensenellaceae bacterium OttesenSCG-928-L17]